MGSRDGLGRDVSVVVSSEKHLLLLGRLLLLGGLLLLGRLLLLGGGLLLGRGLLLQGGREEGGETGDVGGRKIVSFQLYNTWSPEPTQHHRVAAAHHRHTPRTLGAAFFFFGAAFFFLAAGFFLTAAFFLDAHYAVLDRNRVL